MHRIISSALLILSFSALGIPAASGAPTKPAVAHVTPAKGPTTGGTVVTVTGRNFVHVRVVYFGSSKGSGVRTLSTGRLQVIAPVHAAGAVNVTVVTSGGTSKMTTADRYTFGASRTSTAVARAVTVGTGGGSDFGCVLTPTGGVKCWGDNGYGELGNGSTTSSKSPVPVTGLGSGVVQVTAGSNFACAVTSTGGVKCWGWEYSGVLGNGVDSNGYSDVPVDVTGLTTGVKSIAVGGGSACALLVSGAVECWGNNNNSQLGTNTTAYNSAVPVVIAGLPANVQSIAVSIGTVCVLVSGGGVLCWGLFPGATSAPTLTATPTAVTGIPGGAQQISAGNSVVCAVTTAGAVLCWGSNYDGELGVASTSFESSTPVAIPGLGSGQRFVAVGEGTTCSLSTGGGVMCWGYNYDGTLGNSTEVNSYVPVKVTGVSTGASAIAVSTYTSCALLTGGSIKCWGYVPVGTGITDVPVSLPWFG